MEDVTPLTTSATTGSVPAGTVVAYFGNAQSIPAGWFLCNGRQLTSDEINKYPSLANILAPYNYCIPDLSGRTIVGLGSSGGIDFGLTQTGGEYTHKITQEEMPSHNHYGWGEAYNGNSPYNWGGNLGFTSGKGYYGSKSSDNDNFLYGSTFAGGVYADTQKIGTTQGTTGNSPADNNAHNNMQPYYVLSYMICGG